MSKRIGKVFSALTTSTVVFIHRSLGVRGAPEAASRRYES